MSAVLTRHGITVEDAEIRAGAARVGAGGGRNRAFDPTAALHEERQAFAARREALASQIASLNQAKELGEREVEFSKAKETALARQGALLQKELDNINALMNKGLAVTSQKLALEQGVLQSETNRLDLKLSTLKAQQEVGKIERGIMDLVNQWRNEAVVEFNKTQATLATLVTAGAPVQPVALPTTTFPTKDLSHATIAARQTLVFSENKAQTQYYINGKQYDMNRVDIRSKLNTVEEWTIRNASTEEHSFHIHTNAFQLMSINGRPHQGHGLQDTASIPANGWMVVRIHFTDYTGKTVVHCHILNHEDAGMMAILEIVK